MERGDKVGLVQVLAFMKAGLSPAQISKKYNIPKQNISYFVGKLKKKGCIEKKGYGVWKYLKPFEKSNFNYKGSQKGQVGLVKEIRGHAFIWKINFRMPIDLPWEEKIKKTNLSFQKICHGKVIRIIFENRKIWLTRKGMVIYEAMDFMGESSFKVKGVAVFEMDKLIKKLLKKVRVGFVPYVFTTSREHYGIIKNELARQYNDKKQKMHIRGEDGSVWMWIDDSHSLGELENNEPLVNRQVQNFWNDHKKTKFEVTPTKILKKFKDHDQIINKSMEVLEDYSEQIALHLHVEKEQLKTQLETQKLLKKIGRNYNGKQKK